MSTQIAQSRPAEKVRKIAELALSDAVEITLLTGLLRQQNVDGINKGLDKAGAGKAARALQNALIARLVTLIARAYATPKHGDMHVRVAESLLKDNTTRQIFGIGDGSKKLAAFDTHWAKCRGDHRLPAIKDFRNKYTAHLGEPKDLEEATYQDLFAFGAATAKAMELLALAARVAVNALDTDPDLVSSPEIFWSHWKQP